SYNTHSCTHFLVPQPHSSAPHHQLHFFPTRRSSDLSTRRSSVVMGASSLCTSLTMKRKTTQPANSPATTEIPRDAKARRRAWRVDRKSTRLNFSHQIISYAVFCL